MILIFSCDYLTSMGDLELAFILVMWQMSWEAILMPRYLYAKFIYLESSE